MGFWHQTTQTSARADNWNWYMKRQFSWPMLCPLLAWKRTGRSCMCHLDKQNKSNSSSSSRAETLRIRHRRRRRTIWKFIILRTHKPNGKWVNTTNVKSYTHTHSYTQAQAEVARGPQTLRSLFICFSIFYFMRHIFYVPIYKNIVYIRIFLKCSYFFILFCSVLDHMRFTFTLISNN